MRRAPHRALLPILLLPMAVLSGLSPAAPDAKAVHAQIVALDAAFAKALKANDLSAYRATKDKATALIAQLGRDPTDPCRTAAIYMESSRSLQWITEHSTVPSANDRRIDAANLKDAKDALGRCKASLK